MPRHLLKLLIIDVILVFFATIAAIVLRDNLELSWRRLSDLAPYILVCVVASVPVLALFGLNRSLWRFSSMSDYLKIVTVSIVIVFTTFVFDFMFSRLEFIPRSLPFIQALLIIFALVGARVVVRLHHHSHRVRPVPDVVVPIVNRDARMVLLVGLTRLAELYLRAAQDYAADQVEVAGLLAVEGGEPHGESFQGLPVFGRVEDCAEIVEKLRIHGIVVDRIVLAMPLRMLTKAARRALDDLEEASELEFDSLCDRIFDRNDVEESDDDEVPGTVADERLFRIDPDVRAAVMSRPYWRIKRLIDIVGAMVLLVVFAVPSIVVGFVVLVDIGTPITFWQRRPGLFGRPFRLFKFRTMRDARDEEGNLAPDSHRLSAVGRFLRRTRLDELPQLYHILVGDMSFVGPRPLLPVDQSEAFSARLLVRPGLTGWAQVQGGREISAVDKAALDVWYVLNASLLLDIEIVLRTIPMVLVGERLNTREIDRVWDDLAASGVCDRDGAGLPNGGPVPSA